MYVIMAQDVTDPPFLGQRLEPGFLEVKLALPKKAKKVVKKEKGPKYVVIFYIKILLHCFSLYMLQYIYNVVYISLVSYFKYICLF